MNTGGAILFIRHQYSNPKKRTLLRVLATLLVLNLYFLAQLFLGQNSIVHKKKLNLIKQEKSYTLSKLISQNEMLRLELELMQEGNLDIDYLDELVRRQLNYSAREEMVLIY
jgi:cell division protein FtsB